MSDTVVTPVLAGAARLPEPGPLPNRLQLTDDGQLRHLLTIEGLNRDLLNEILDTAESSRT